MVVSKKIGNAKEIAVTKLRYPSAEELHAFERYTAHFEMAQRWELALDAAIKAWRRVRTWTGKVLQASPRARYRH